MNNGELLRMSQCGRCDKYMGRGNCRKYGYTPTSKDSCFLKNTENDCSSFGTNKLKKIFNYYCS